MTTEFRNVCAELLAAIQLYTKLNPAASDMSPFELTEKLMDAMAATGAALAQPAAEGVLPLKERPDFIAGYGEGLADGRRIIEREEAERPTPQPPADGEVAELVAWLQDRADSTSIAANANRASRIADLLQHQHPQPAAEGPTDEELYELWVQNGFEIDRFARAVLARWGHPKPPSEADQALALLNDCADRLDGAHENAIRRALELLKELERTFHE